MARKRKLYEPETELRKCPYCGGNTNATIYKKERVWGGICNHCCKIISCQPLDTGIIVKAKE